MLLFAVNIWHALQTSTNGTSSRHFCDALSERHTLCWFLLTLCTSVVSCLQVCHLVEVNGLARLVYSDAPVAPLDTAGMLVREDPIPGTNYDNGRLVLAELGYADDSPQ